MADSVNLELTFGDGDGGEIKMNFPYADIDVAASDVKTLMTTIVSKKDCFQAEPVSILEAKLIRRDETEVALPA